MSGLIGTYLIIPRDPGHLGAGEDAASLVWAALRDQAAATCCIPTETHQSPTRMEVCQSGKGAGGLWGRDYRGRFPVADAVPETSLGWRFLHGR